MVVIRLARNGKKHDPIYKIMVAHKDVAATGKFIEQLGIYNPRKAYEGGITFKKERYEHWIAQGAQPSKTVLNLVNKLARDGFAQRPAPEKKKKAAPKAEATEAKAEEKVEAAEGEEKKEETPKAEEKKEETPAAEEKMEDEGGPPKEEAPAAEEKKEEEK